MPRSILVWMVVAAIAGCAHIGIHMNRPHTPKEPVTDTYHGTKVVDEYRWLEDWSDPRVREWSDAQNAYTRSVLDASPSAIPLRARVTEILDMTPASYQAISWREGRLFALKTKPPLNQPFLVTMTSTVDRDTERVILDPNGIDASGSTTIDWYVPSPDGSLVAVSLSVGGSESGDLHIYETDTGAELGDAIERVNGGTAGGDLAWAPDGKGFYYTRYPRPGERPESEAGFFQQLWFHRLGTPVSEDRYELGRGFGPTAEIEVEAESGSGRILATVQQGDSGRFALHVREEDGHWRPISQWGDGVVQAAFEPRGGLFLISRHHASHGKLLYLPSTDTPIGQARKIIPEGDHVIVSEFYGARTMVVTETRLYLTYQLGGPSEIRAFDHNGRPAPGPDVPGLSGVGRNLVPLQGDNILFGLSSYLEPDRWYHFDASTGRTEKTALSTDDTVSFEDAEVVREFVVSKDGTRVPINILRPRGARLLGRTPAILYGYGGFGVSVEPRYDPLRRIWLDHGGIYAFANIRGGGEFGDEWHREGMLKKKQNAFDDFAACIKYLFEVGYTNSENLVLEGRSNGGLLMGAMITQYPEAARTVVAHVGIYDMLRVELSANGSFNVPEYGSVKLPAQFEAMYAYSPYHRVVDGASYPAVLFMTGENDPRVDPMHSRKMVARLQEATSSPRPILLRTSGVGHGRSTPLKARIDQHTDVFAFVFDQLEIRFVVE